jgi:hypothetical protein
MKCQGCRHEIQQHSEVCGCLVCRCAYVRAGDTTINPQGRYAAEFIAGEVDA